MLEEVGVARGGYQAVSGPQEVCCFTHAALTGPHCCRCARRRVASPLACLAVSALLLTYNLLGGVLFLALEGTHAEETAVAASKPNLSHANSGTDLRVKTVERLWSITEDLNILYKENWTQLAAKELLDFQRVLVKTIRVDALHSRRSPHQTRDYRWTFSSSFLYALTLITTIGHGDVTPKSTVGKMAAVAYACVGIPVVMVYLSAVGDALARRFRTLYGRLARPRHVTPPPPPQRTQPQTPFQTALNLGTLSRPHHSTCGAHTRVPVPLSLLLLVLYVALGTLVFHMTERWPLLDGCYFSFAALATIGFGPLTPGAHASTVSSNAEEMALAVCCGYILVGVLVVAMCFNLIQEELSGRLQGVSAVCAGGGAKTHAALTGPS